jgi:hypothetical protein
MDNIHKPSDSEDPLDATRKEQSVSLTGKDLTIHQPLRVDEIIYFTAHIKFAV